MKTKIRMVVLMCGVLTGAAAAQMEQLKAGPEQKKLDVLAGAWTLNGDMKPGPAGSGGKSLETETCDWMEGGFFLICHTHFKIAGLPDGTGLTVMGYNADDKTYSYREFNSYGEFVDSRGTVDGDTWTWTNDQKMGAMTMKGKFTMKNVKVGSYDFAYEVSQDGTKWTTVVDGNATKK